MALTPEEYVNNNLTTIAHVVARLVRHYSPLTPLTIDDVHSIANMELWQLAITPNKRDTINNLDGWLYTVASRQLSRELDKARSPVTLTNYALQYAMHATNSPRPYKAVPLDHSPEPTSIDETSIEFIMFDLQRNKSAQEKQFIEWWLKDIAQAGKKPTMTETRTKLKELNIANHDMFLAALMDTLAEYRDNKETTL